MKFWNTAIYGILIFAAPHLGQAQVAHEERTPSSAASFVQHFYDWYVPFALTDHKQPAWDEVVTRKPALLGRTLARALRADLLTQAQSPGELTGLDFDPFLNAQDPCDHYNVGKALRTGKNYKVEVRGVCSTGVEGRPDVVVDMVPKGSSWAFVNFYYPHANSDLLTVLRRLHNKGAKHYR